MHSSSVRSTWVLVAALASGCGTKAPSVDETIGQYRARVEPKIAVAERVGKALPALSADGIKLSGPKLSLTYLSHSGDPPKQIGNAAVVYAADLADVTTYGNVELRVTDAELKPVVNNCAAILRKKSMAKGNVLLEETMSGSRVAKYLPICAALQYLVVINPRTVVKPTLDEKSKTFNPGIFRGDVLVFDASSGASLGGFRVDLTQAADTVKVKAGGEVEIGFITEVGAAIRDGLKKHAGG